MGQKFTFEHSGHTRATAQDAFTALADAPEWAKWGKPIIATSKFVKPASPDPHGVGAVRGSGAVEPFLLKEETTVYEPGSQFGYKLISPSPMRNYGGLVTFTTNPNGGTDILWRVEFEELIPRSGAVLRAGLGKMIGTFLNKLIRYLDAKA